MKFVPQCVSTEFQRHNKYWYQFVKTEKAHFPGNLYHYVHMTIALLWWIYGGILFWIDKKNSLGKWRFLQALRKHKITRNWCSSHNAHCRRHWYFSSIYLLRPVTREVCITSFSLQETSQWRRKNIKNSQISREVLRVCFVVCRSVVWMPIVKAVFYLCFCSIALKQNHKLNRSAVMQLCILGSFKSSFCC